MAFASCNSIKLKNDNLKSPHSSITDNNLAVISNSPKFASQIQCALHSPTQADDHSHAENFLPGSVSLALIDVG
jgi:hypothetical protein